MCRVNLPSLEVNRQETEGGRGTQELLTGSTSQQQEPKNDLLLSCSGFPGCQTEGRSDPHGPARGTQLLRLVVGPHNGVSVPSVPRIWVLSMTSGTPSVQELRTPLRRCAPVVSARTGTWRPHTPPRRCSCINSLSKSR